MSDKDKNRDILGKIHKHKRVSVKHDEIEKILQCCDHNLRALILVQSSSGLRVGELIGLRVGELIGLRVGELIGLRVGELIGLRVGELIGLRVGDVIKLERYQIKSELIIQRHEQRD